MNSDFNNRLSKVVAVIKVILRYWEKLFGKILFVVVLCLLYWKNITRDEAIFYIVILTAAGYIHNDKIDIFDILKYLGNYKKGGKDESA